MRFGTHGPGGPWRRLVILDTQDRLVRACLPGEGEPSAAGIRWNGRDAAGFRAPAGRYFWRLEGPDGSIRGTLVRVR